LAEGGDEEVQVAVAVDVRRHPTHAVAFDLDARAGGDVDEVAGAVVPEEPGPRRLALVPREAPAVDEEDVQVPVAVVVEEHDPAAHHLDHVVPARAAMVVAEVEPPGGGDLAEAERAGREGGGPGEEDGQGEGGWAAGGAGTADGGAPLARGSV